MHNELPPPHKISEPIIGSLYNKHSHLKTIDYLRAISALLIILFHYTYRYNYKEIIVSSNATIDFPFSISWGYGAVTTFFVLSGYFMAKNFETANIHPFRVLKKRLWRLYPSFWACMTLSTILIFLLFPEIQITVTQFIFNLTMIPSNFNVQFIDGAYWTLAYEFKFAVFFCCILFFRNLKVRKFLISLWLLASVFLGFFQDSASSQLLFIFRGVLITDFIHTFISGICLESYKNDKPFYSMMLILCCINQYCWFGFDYIYGLFFIIPVILLIFLPWLERINLPTSVYLPFKFIAQISYPLYLMHQMVGYAIIKNLKAIGLENELWLIVPFSVSVFIAYMVHRFVEIPATKFEFKSRLARN